MNVLRTHSRLRRARLDAGPLAMGLWLLTTFVTAHEGPQREKVVTETASVTVIEIPVNVIGRDGKPLAGLRAADFDLYDDEKKQKISGFEVIDLNRSIRESPPGPDSVTEPSSPSARRHWMIVFDLSYTSLTSLVRAREGAKAFVSTEMKDDDLCSVATLSVEMGWKLLINFTRDRRQLSNAIQTLGLPALAARTPDPLVFMVEPPGEQDSRRRSGPDSADVDILKRDLRTLRQTASDDLDRGRVAQLMKSLAAMALALDSVRGRKHVLFFSEGFETRLLSGNAGQKMASPLQDTAPDQDTAGEAAIQGEHWKIDSDARFGSSSTRAFLANALSLFNRSDAVLHTIDIAGLRAEGEVAKKPRSGTDALFAMAAQTGGEFVRNANELKGELGKLVERTGLIYLLVYQPTKLTLPGTFHTLRVKVRAPHARVSARSGYYEPRPYRSLSPIERVLASGDLVTGGHRENGVSARLLAAPFPSEGKLAQVPVILEIPFLPLVAGEAGAQTALEIYAYATDPRGSLTDYLAQEMTLDVSKLRAKPEIEGIKFYGTLFLPTGDCTVRALVRNGTTGRSAVMATSFRVPAVPGGLATMLPPFFEEPPGGWVMVKATTRADTPSRTADYPFAIAGESFIPAALPVLKNSAEARVAVFTYNFGNGPEPSPMEVRGEIIGMGEKPRPVKLEVRRRSDLERGDGRKLLLGFKPEGLAPGRYSLRVAARDPTSNRVLESASIFEVK